MDYQAFHDGAQAGRKSVMYAAWRSTAPPGPDRWRTAGTDHTEGAHADRAVDSTTPGDGPRWRTARPPETDTATEPAPGRGRHRGARRPSHRRWPWHAA
jgi:hypothetical protein